MGQRVARIICLDEMRTHVQAVVRLYAGARQRRIRWDVSVWSGAEHDERSSGCVTTHRNEWGGRAAVEQQGDGPYGVCPVIPLTSGIVTDHPS